MALEYLLAGNPIWYFADTVGRPLGSGYFATYNAQNPSQLKPVFEDPAGLFSWPYVNIPNTNLQGILIDENGTSGPFYFANDVPYLLMTFDENGIPQWTVDNFVPPVGSGGGDIVEAFDFTNLVVNNVFWRAEINAPVSGAANVFLCPGAHSNFCNSTVPNNQPDIRFIKSNTAATDTLTFIPFTPGINALPGDITPPIYLRYSCTAIGGGGETFKYVQHPISTDLQSTSGKQAVTTIWARCNSGANAITVQYRQFFGDGGGASPSVLSAGQTFNLTTDWEQYSFTDNIPSIAGKTLGACQNTALYLQIQYPLSQTTSIDFVKASSYLSTVGPDIEYLTNDQIDAVINAPRVGDVRVALNQFQPYGWVICNDGTIGNPSSGSTTRANFDTFALFDCIWTNVSATLAPMFTSAGVPVARGASSVDDYAANRRLSLTKVLGRALSSAGQPSTGGSGNTWPVGTAQGEENHTLTIAEMPNHDHPGSTIGSSTDVNAGSFVQRSNINNVALAVTVAPQGDGGGHNTIQPTAYFNVFLKL